MFTRGESIVSEQQGGNPRTPLGCFTGRVAFYSFSENEHRPVNNELILRTYPASQGKQDNDRRPVRENDEYYSYATSPNA